jgi:hypothetical protein
VADDEAPVSARVVSLDAYRATRAPVEPYGGIDPDHEADVLLLPWPSQGQREAVALLCRAIGLMDANDAEAPF